MGYVLDIITIIIIVFFAFTGYQKGVLKTVISVVGTLLASLMSSVLSKPIAEAIYNGGFKTAIISKAESGLKQVSQEGGTFIDKFMKTMPSFVESSLRGFGMNDDTLTAAAAKGAAQLERTLAPLIISFITVIVSIVLFVALLIIAKIVCSLIYAGMESFSVSVIDNMFGAVIAMLEGFIIVMLAAFIIRIAIPHFDNVPEIFSDETISESTVFKGIYNSPILTELVSSVTDSPNDKPVE